MSAAAPPDSHSAYLALGANLGDACQSVRAAIAAIAHWPHTRLLAASPLYRSAPVDATGPDFVNAVVQVQTALSPTQLLHSAQATEQAAGRQRPWPNAPRTLDIDILLYDDLRLDTPELTLPHPRMTQRAFVLLPLADIAAQLVSPAQRKAVAHQRLLKISA